MGHRILLVVSCASLRQELFFPLFSPTDREIHLALLSPGPQPRARANRLGDNGEAPNRPPDRNPEPALAGHHWNGTALTGRRLGKTSFRLFSHNRLRDFPFLICTLFWSTPPPMSKAQQLQAMAANLPEQIASEVLDFLDFVTAKHTLERTARTDAIKSLRGAFKGRLSTAAEFSAKKSDEIRLDG
jgi:hypothetical protein